MFVDKPESLLQNHFIKSESISVKNILMDKINEIKKTQQVDTGSGFCIKVDAPFHDSPLRKLVIMELKIWNGTSEYQTYIK